MPNTSGVSIHAPRVGRDFAFLLKRPSLSCFNSRAPRGARRCLPAGLVITQRVSIHAPRVGRDITTRAFATALREFQFTRPAWGATCACAHVARGKHGFNSRAPRGARRGRQAHKFIGMRFNSRAPRGARLDPRRLYAVRDVSIHAPRVGRDWSWV